MLVGEEHVSFPGGLPVIDGKVIRLTSEWAFACMACGERLEVAAAVRETLKDQASIEHAILTCPQCKMPHCVTDGQRALILGPLDDPAPERPVGLVVGLCTTPASLAQKAEAGELGSPLTHVNVNRAPPMLGNRTRKGNSGIRFCGWDRIVTTPKGGTQIIRGKNCQCMKQEGG